ncbi:MAG TPA: endo-1,4-beta-xylanase, partial [Polyangiaceae bacterium]|nr:endo-1,4-beta-xylanase [Polyangiaceae bacterium]
GGGATTNANQDKATGGSKATSGTKSSNSSSSGKGGQVQQGAGGSKGTTKVAAGGSKSSSEEDVGGAEQGGNDAAGGKAAGGAKTATGGQAAGGGKSTSGPKAAGGSVATGGGKAAGGAGTAGGSKAAGGDVATGGKAAGGAVSAGGSATGGSKAMGGGDDATGGGAATPTVAKFVGNITTSNGCDAGGKKYSTYWNQITPENAGKWGSVQSSAGSSFNWSTLDSIYDYATKNNVIFKHHVFVWGSQQPSGTPTQAQIKTWMSEYCKRYPKTALIDVVNEPPPHTTPSYVSNMGGGTNGDWTWITNAFKWAREACGADKILILNDYNNIEWPDETDHFISIVKKIKAAGAPVDAVGAQSHDVDHASATWSKVKGLLEKLHTDTGLPVYITELDLSYTDDTQQLNKYKEIFPYMMETEWIKGITIWGWIYGSTWSQAPDSGLIKNGTFRPAMKYLMETLGRPTS